MQRLISERAIQSKMMSDVAILIRIVLSYGGHIIIENPTHSKIWTQTFMKCTMADVDRVHHGRSFRLNRCRLAGGVHFKQFKLYTSLPPHATNHMENLTCDHHFKHPPCLGRDANGRSVTRASGVYTRSLTLMLVACIGLLVGLPSIVKTIGKSVHTTKSALHEHFRVGTSSSFEEANTFDYLRADSYLRLTNTCQHEDSGLPNNLDATSDVNVVSPETITSHEAYHSCATSSRVSETVPMSTDSTPVRGGGAFPTHLWMSGRGAQRIMRGVCLVSEVDVSEGMVHVALATNTPKISTDKNTLFYFIPLSHLRPYVSSLEGAPWTSDDPADENHNNMKRCDEPMCNMPATHNDGSQEHEYMCCRHHCTCYDSYTGEHMHANNINNVTLGNGPVDHEINLSEKKLRLYWDRTRDIPAKAVLTLSNIRYDPNTSSQRPKICKI